MELWQPLCDNEVIINQNTLVADRRRRQRAVVQTGFSFIVLVILVMSAQC